MLRSKEPREPSNGSGRPPTLRLLVITMLYEPDNVGIATIASDMCVALAERGHDITVYTTYPFYPEWRHKSDASPWRIQRETIANVNIRRHGLFVPANPSRILPRLMHELSFPISLMRSLFDRGPYDAVMVYCPLLGSVAFAAFRKLWYREPLWVNIQDIPTDAAVASGINRSRIFHRMASTVQKFLLGRGEVWSSISPDMVERLNAIKPAKTTIQTFPNWLTGSLRDQVQELPSKIGTPPHRPLKLLYCGTIGKKQGLLDFCERIRSLKMEFQFQIRGAGSEAEAIKKWVEVGQDTRFEFGELLPESEFVRAIHAADWFVVPEKSGAGCSFLPSKIIPSISAGTPILAISDRSGPLGREVIQNGVGMVVEWSHLNQLPSALAEFALEPARFETLQKNCMEHAKLYNRDHAIDRLELLLLACKRS